MPTDAWGRPSLSVVISAGQPRDKNSRVREVAVVVHGLTDSEKRDGILFVYEDMRRTKELARLPLRESIAEENLGSIKVPTGLKFDPTWWRPDSFPTGNITYYSNIRVLNRVVVEGCLRVQPRWMEELLPEIRRLALFDMAIPSTHQSGAYKIFKGQNIVNRYRDCQEEDVFTQLLYGIRALDLRPAATKNASSAYEGFDYWIYHHRFPTKNSVKSILEDVRSFLDLFPNEVVFVDFHEFPSGFKNSSSFRGLEKLVVEVLGHHIYTKDRTYPAFATLENVVQGGKRAIVTFERNDDLKDRYYSGIRHIWGNTDKLDKLKRIITDRQIQWKHQRWFFNAMAQTTAQGAWSVISDKYRGGVRGIAHRDNFDISTWFRHDRDARTYSNFIAVDYFLSTDIVDLCKDINLERAHT
ncbi:uncharacterized protein LOC100897356 [Galendromus occidentalis]|uniref:Uncharacterized protein LOC100897356 n=1 Tax=Galendromus occidentalis TaxID=34638 RepID=A0AAJ7L5L8_9ACAR|nr:uncharacterized protein LOC100897356 [Galendromus occidentalis]